MILIMSVKEILLNVHSQLEAARGLSLYLLPYFMHRNSEGSDQNAWMGRLTRAFAGCIYNMYQDPMGWIIYFIIKISVWFYVVGCNYPESI